MTVVNRSTSSLQQQIASSDMDRRTRAGRGAVSRIPAEADSGSLRAARSGPSPLLDPYPKTLGPAAPRRPGASPTGNIQLKCMSTGERDTSMVMAATGGGRRLPRSLMPTNVPRADHKRVVATPFLVDAALIAVDPQGIRLRHNLPSSASGTGRWFGLGPTRGSWNRARVAAARHHPAVDGSSPAPGSARPSDCSCR